MDKNKFLEAAATLLKKQKLYVVFKEENLVELSTSKHEKVFAFLVVEKDQFPGIILSISVDYPNTYLIADLVINLMHIAPVALGEGFFRSANGRVYWEEDAYKQFAIESNTDILKDIPTDRTLH